MVKKSIGGLSFGPTAAGLGDIRLGMSIPITPQCNKALHQAGISQRGTAPFLFGPIVGRRDFLLDGTAQQLTPLSMEWIDVHLLLRQCCVMLAVLSATTNGRADMSPVGSAIAGPGKATLLNKSLYQQRFFPITDVPVPFQATQRFPQNMGGQMRNTNFRVDEKTTITDYPVQIAKTVLLVPADKLVAN